MAFDSFSAFSYVYMKLLRYFCEFFHPSDFLNLLSSNAYYMHVGKISFLNHYFSCDFNGFGLS